MYVLIPYLIANVNPERTAGFFLMFLNLHGCIKSVNKAIGLINHLISGTLNHLHNWMYVSINCISMVILCLE